jgi:ribosomal protein L32
VEDDRRTDDQHVAEPSVVVRCAWCGRVKVESEWQDEDEVQAMRLLRPTQHLSHGICPSCLARYTDRTV